MKKIRYLCEALLLHILFLIFRLMPVDTASAIGGWLGRMIGPRLAASRKALRNLEHALPALNETEKRQIICKMWDNLGRVFAEYPHQHKQWPDNDHPILKLHLLIVKRSIRQWLYRFELSQSSPPCAHLYASLIVERCSPLHYK